MQSIYCNIYVFCRQSTNVMNSTCVDLLYTVHGKKIRSLQIILNSMPSLGHQKLSNTCFTTPDHTQPFLSIYAPIESLRTHLIPLDPIWTWLAPLAPYWPPLIGQFKRCLYVWTHSVKIAITWPANNSCHWGKTGHIGRFWFISSL